MIVLCKACHRACKAIGEFIWRRDIIRAFSKESPSGHRLSFYVYQDSFLTCFATSLGALKHSWVQMLGGIVSLLTLTVLRYWQSFLFLWFTSIRRLHYLSVIQKPLGKKKRRGNERYKNNIKCSLYDKHCSKQLACIISLILKTILWGRD